MAYEGFTIHPFFSENGAQKVCTVVTEALIHKVQNNKKNCIHLAVQP